MGLAECIGVYKELKENKLLNNKQASDIVFLQNFLKYKADEKILKNYEEKGKIKVKKIISNSYKIKNTLMGCINLKKQLRH